MRNAIHSFDDRITAWVQGWPAWLHQPMLAITNVGQPTTVIIFIVGLIVWSVWRDASSLATAGLIVLVTVLLSAIIKFIMRRARPINEYVRRMFFRTYSFPSGHATAATGGLGLLSYLVALSLPHPWGALLALLVAVFAVMVGVSRIYLGAHYPSDVVGGMVLGLAGLGFAISVIT